MATIVAVSSVALVTFAGEAQAGQAGSETVIPRAARPEKPTPNTDAMIWRFIGPMTGTRASVTIGHPTEKTVFYAGVSGGLWKTPDAANQWYQATISGALKAFKNAIGG